MCGRVGAVLLLVALGGAACGGGAAEGAPDLDCPSAAAEGATPTPSLDPRCAVGAQERQPEGGEGGEEDGSLVGRWEGTFESSSTGAMCESSYSGEIRLRADREGRVAGRLTASGSFTCNPGGTVEEPGLRLDLTGSFDGGELRLLGAPGGPGEVGLGPSSCFAQGEVVLPVTGGTAEAEYAYEAPSGDGYRCQLLLVAEGG